MSDPAFGDEPSRALDRPLRIAVLWQRMTGYLNACLHALTATGRVSLRVAYAAPSKDAPYDETDFSPFLRQYRWHDRPDRKGLSALLDEEGLDAILVCSWNVPAYRARLPALGRQGVIRVLCMDNQWNSTPRQWLGRLTWRQYLRPYYDLAFVPGYRQLQFARRLGFQHEHIMRGLLSADTPAFTMPPAWGGKRERSFLYVGRLAPEKGLSTLVQAYGDYRQSVDDPWPLLIAGTGPGVHVFDGVSGVRMLGFLQPKSLPVAMWSATVAICPSLFEPWGVVVHEATAAGLVVVCSEAVGAGVHLVQDGFNGFVVPTGDASDLARAMTALTCAPEERLSAMSQASVLLSKQFSPERWAQYVLEMLAWRG
jgi:glycosyltransferase involved in cell wall biosynthesis